MNRRHILKIQGVNLVAEGWGLLALVVIVAASLAWRMLGG